MAVVAAGVWALTSLKWNKSRVAWSTLILCAVLLGGVSAKASFQKIKTKKISIHGKPSSHRLYKWIKDHTPPGSLFLTPPGSYQMFRVATHRAQIVDFKSVPVANGKDMMEWYRRLRIVGHINSDKFPRRKWWRYARHLNSRYAKASPSQRKDVMNKFKADYFLTKYEEEQKHLDFLEQGFKEVYRSNNKIIYQYSNKEVANMSLEKPL